LRGWRTIEAVKEVRLAKNDPAFLLKAISEAAGELRRALAGMPRRALLVPGAGYDDGWTLLGIAVHLRDTEEGLHGQLEAMVYSREPELAAVDVDDVPSLESYRDEEVDEVLEEFASTRHSTAYLLWDMYSSDWERGGLHPYRGRVTVLELVRDMYQHDLEHLWQVNRMVERLHAPSR
jgi:hypothetical protein